MLKKFICSLFICFCFSAIGAALPVPHFHPDNENEGKGIGFKVGYEYQKSTYLEAGLLFHHWKGLSGGPIGFRAIGAGAECRIGGSNLYYGPKIFAEVTALWLGGRAALTYLTDSRQGALIGSPEIGFSAGGYMYLYLGANVNLTNKDFLNMNGFRLSLGFNLYALDKL